jgi:hypothetical protein
MPSSVVQKFALLCLLAVLIAPAGAVQPRTGVPHPIAPHPAPPPSLFELINKAGYIFTGTVTDVERISPMNANEVATIQITFRVQQGFRGARAGQSLVIHEWAGLWQSGERYRRGDRALLFFYPQSKLGLTSPTGGLLGRFPVDGRGQVVLKPIVLSLFARNPRLQNQLRGKARLEAGEFARLLLGTQE